MPFAAWLIEEISPKTFVELGTHYGASYFTFCQAVAEFKKATKCYAVDLWEGDEHAGFYEQNVYEFVRSYNLEHYQSFSSLLKTKFDDAVHYFAEQSIDLLHIDGFHTYEAVRNDFETWLPKLAPGAVVIFHDTNVRERGFGVWKCWAELQEIYPHNIEFFHSYGLGVLQLNNCPDSQTLDWLKPDYAEKSLLRDYFSALGERQFERQFERQLEHQQKIEIERLRAETIKLSDELKNLHAVRNRNPLRRIARRLLRD